MRKEYALGASRPNPYAKRLGDRGRAVLEQRYFESEGYVRLDADVARAFTDADSVNEALRLVVRLRKVGEAPRRKSTPVLVSRLSSLPRSPSTGTPRSRR